MNFLELCQKTHKICSVDGDNIVSVNNQTGMNERVVDWVNRAYEDIQRHRTDWKFRQVLSNLTFVSGQGTASDLRASLEHIDPRTITFTTTGATTVRNLLHLDYDIFYDKLESRERTTALPKYLSVNNQNDVVIDPLPSSDIVVKFHYTKTVEPLIDNTDEPIIREAYQDSIIWKAAIYYAEEQEAEGIFQTATMNYKTILNRMELDLRPKVSLKFTPLA